MADTPAILVFGRNGQVGHALKGALAPLGSLYLAGRQDCDLAAPDRIRAFLEGHAPDFIVNAAAYTAVDRAESEPDLARAVNEAAPRAMAEYVEDAGATLIHFSTDYVFDGAKADAYVEDDPPNPLSVYGRTKLAGEDAIRAIAQRHIVLRTSWVFGDHGNNFLKTMLRLARERDELAIVADQWGAPTSAALIARTTAAIISRLIDAPEHAAYGTFHLAAAGRTTWHAYAVTAIEHARKLGLPVRLASDAIRPIESSAYPTAAKRPRNSCLDTARIRSSYGVELPVWERDVCDTVNLLVNSWNAQK